MSVRKGEVKQIIKEILSQRNEVIFAYLYGSFLRSSFRDVDIAVYIDETKVKDYLSYGLKLGIEVETHVRLPIDLRVLNQAPLSFSYEVIKGELLVSKDEELRCRFIERVVVKYLDFKPIEEQMVKDVLSP